MESRKFYEYLEARDAILSEERLEDIWVYNYSKLNQKAKRKASKRWEKKAYGWMPKKKIELSDAIKMLGKING